MSVTQRQREILADLHTAIAYFRDFEQKTDGVSFTAIAAKAGIENLGSVYSAIESIKTNRTAEGLQELQKLRSEMKTVGLKVKVLDKIPSPREAGIPFVSSGTSTGPVEERDIVAAWNQCAKALQSVPQDARGNLVNSLAMFFGIGAI